MSSYSDERFMQSRCRSGVDLLNAQCMSRLDEGLVQLCQGRTRLLATRDRSRAVGALSKVHADSKDESGGRGPESGGKDP
eukprot:3545195-Pleurochrysis_carterae.AAC.1